MSQDENQAWVHLMTKLPVPGTVKTRLIKDLGVEGATQAYWDLLAWVLSKIYDPKRWHHAVWITGLGQVEKQFLKLFEPDCYQFKRQCEGGLGERINLVLASPGSKHFVVGGDCVSVDQDIIHRVFKCLDHHDVGIGPTRDGGFYFIAAKAPIQDLHTQIRWGSEYAFNDVIRLCQNQGFSVAEFETGSDVDTLDDWRAFLERVHPYTK